MIYFLMAEEEGLETIIAFKVLIAFQASHLGILPASFELDLNLLHLNLCLD
jgi:hypothetical protein